MGATGLLFKYDLGSLRTRWPGINSQSDWAGNYTSTAASESEPAAFPLRYTHYWVSVTAANVQGTIGQVEPSEAAGSLGRKGQDS